MAPPELPVALGVIRAIVAPTYSDNIINQIEAVKENSKIKCMDDLMNSGNTWEVK